MSPRVNIYKRLGQRARPAHLPPLRPGSGKQRGRSRGRGRGRGRGRAKSDTHVGHGHGHSHSSASGSTASSSSTLSGGSAGASHSASEGRIDWYPTIEGMGEGDGDFSAIRRVRACCRHKYQNQTRPPAWRLMHSEFDSIREYFFRNEIPHVFGNMYFIEKCTDFIAK